MISKKCQRHWLVRVGEVLYMYNVACVTAPCLGIFFYHVQVVDMCHRVFGASVVVDLPLLRSLGVVYLLYSPLALELKAVDTQCLCRPLDRRVESVHTDTSGVLRLVHVVE